MAQLNSPGVSVSVIDESFYTPAAPGTVPLIFIATEENKVNGSSTGVAPGTMSTNAGNVYLLTSQKDLVDTFGVPIFKTDANNNPIHAGEQNEYGLQAAYSLLGVSNLAYVTRANIDLAQLDATGTMPTGKPYNGDWWFDTASTKYGIFEWDASPAIAGGQTFNNKVPTVITELDKMDEGNDYRPKSHIGAIGDYAITSYNNLTKLWYKKSDPGTAVGNWVAVGSPEWSASHPTVQSTSAISNVNTLDLSDETFLINGVDILGVDRVVSQTGLIGLVDVINTGGVDQSPARTISLSTSAISYANDPVALTNVVIESTTGDFSCADASMLGVGKAVRIVGAFTEGSITGYNAAGTTYYVGATDELTTFTLVTSTGSAIATTVPDPLHTPISGATITAGVEPIGNVLHFTNIPLSGTTSLIEGATVTGTGIDTGTTLVSFTSNSVVLSNDIILDVPGSTSITFTTPANDTAPSIPGVTAQLVNNRVELYSTGVGLELSGTGWPLINISTNDGINDIPYSALTLQISKHTQPPQWKSSGIGQSPKPTGSIWLKTTTPNLGADWIVSSYNSATEAWVDIPAPLYSDNLNAIYNIDQVGGGINLSKNTLYVQYNAGENTPAEADFTIMTRRAGGTTSIRSNVLSTGVPTGTLSFTIQESIKRSTVYSPVSPSTITVNLVLNDVDNARTIADAINSTVDINNNPYVNIVASVDSNNRVVLTHKLGGEILITDEGGTIDVSLIFNVDVTNNLYAVANTTDQYVGTLWTSVNDLGANFIPASDTAPTTLTTDGMLWYNSSVDEVDIMIHNGTDWIGYRNCDFGSGAGLTDVSGPTISATAPTTQQDESPLQHGDIWIDTSDIENYPRIYRWDVNYTKWVLVDNTDQTTENGILFADARWTASEGTDENNMGTGDPSTISDLLTSNFLDFDAPDPDLYPKGMLLWNLRRSGFNVKQFKQNYVNVNERNIRQDDAVQTYYYPHRWLSVAANQENGAGTFGRKAQRKVVVQAFQALINSNQSIRDEEGKLFNLIACPGYTEVINEMVTLNYDRGITAFVLGDTPARLTPDATTLSNWGTNVNNVASDGDDGLVTFDEYLGIFYPWGYTSDNYGNNIVVPPSHMMLRTIAISDQVSHPWFAPAGTHRGMVSVDSTGYITSEGEYQPVALNTGQRDTLQQICKVNPITYISGSGYVNYGQMTRARNASALDRINVARLIVYLRRRLSQLAKPYIFEPNDKITRDEIKGAADSLMLDLVGKRALYDFLTVCDETNNTPPRIDRYELYLDIAIEPVKAVEFIFIPLRIMNTGEIKAIG